MKVSHKSTIDADLERYCSKLLEEVERDYTNYSFEAIETFCLLLKRGGKRLRGNLSIAAYNMVGGKDEGVAIGAARITEILQTTLLILDDIADLSDLRRGGPTVHKMFEQYHHDAKLYGNSQHYGLSMALNVGLFGSYLVDAEILKFAVPDSIKLAVMQKVGAGMTTTIHGQLNDITNEAVRLINEKQVERTLTWKSAYYTFLQPIQFGMLLAGSKDAELPLVRDYAMNLGLAFQIIDDIIGTFGEEEKSGKSSKDDLKEGKITILVSRALQQGTAEQKKTLLAALGNHKLSIEQYEACKQIMRETGALDYARDLAEMHSSLAIKALDEAPTHWTEDGIAFLHDLATYVTSRHS